MWCMAGCYFLWNITITLLSHRFWGIKYLVVIGGIIGAFFIPEGQFASTWMVFGMIGGFCYIIIQLILIVDFAHTWAEKWVCEYTLLCIFLSCVYNRMFADSINKYWCSSLAFIADMTSIFLKESSLISEFYDANLYLLC